MNNRPHEPPRQGTITITEILQIRLALEQIANPSTDIQQAKLDLDTHILSFTSSLSSGAPSNG